MTAALTVGILLPAGLAVPAEAGRIGSDAGTGHAAQVADPAPTNVKLAWLDSTHKKFRLSWSEVGAVPNRVEWRYPDQAIPGNVTAADAPNYVDIEPRDGVLESAAIRIAVYVATPAGAPTSPAGLSVPFDTLRSPRPAIDRITAVSPTSFKVEWHPEILADQNPGDPLDVAPGTLQYRVIARLKMVNAYNPVTPLSTATVATFEQVDTPAYWVSVTGTTEWGESRARP